MPNIPETIDVELEPANAISTEATPTTTAMVRVVDVEPMTPAAMIQNVKDIQQMMEQVMKKDHHFGVIPGCGDKPALLKPGAEKLMLMFHLAPSFKINRTDFKGGHREYEIICSLTNQNTGAFVGQGVGLCSTLESKYRYRGAEKISTGNAVPKDYWNLRKADPKKAQEMIGGAGFVTTKDDSGQWMIAKKGERQENPDLPDQYNTVLKMAKKRAQVDACLTATAASDIFAQDIEDMPEFQKDSDKAQNTSQSKSKSPKQSGGQSQQKPAASQQGKSSEPLSSPWRGCVAEVKVVAEGKKNGTPWSVKVIVGKDGNEFSTFSNTDADNARKVINATNKDGTKPIEVVIEFEVTTNKKGYDSNEIQTLASAAKYDAAKNGGDDTPDPNEAPAGTQHTMNTETPAENIGVSEDDIPF